MPRAIRLALLCLCAAWGALSSSATAEAAPESPSRAVHVHDPVENPRQQPWETLCRHPLPENAGFSRHEQWAWNQRLCLGRTADMSQATIAVEPGAKDEASCKPGESNTAPQWPDSRRLSANFLRTVLLFEPWRSAPPRALVSIACARFDDTVVLEGEAVAASVQIVNSHFAGEVSFIGARFARLLNLSGSRFAEGLSGDRMQVEESLFLRDGARLDGELRLLGARIGGSLNFQHSTFRGDVDLEGITVAGNVLLGLSSNDPAKVTLFEKDIVLPRAAIGGHLQGFSIQVKGAFDAFQARIGGAVGLGRGARFDGPVRFNNTVVGGDLSANQAQFLHHFSAQRVRVGGNLNLTGNSVFRGPINLTGAVIDGDLAITGSVAEIDREAAWIKKLLAEGDANAPRWLLEIVTAERAKVGGSVFVRGMKPLAGANFIGLVAGAGFDLSGSRVTGPIDLSHARIDSFILLSSSLHVPPVWESGSALILRNAWTPALQATPDAWSLKDAHADCSAREPELPAARCLVRTDLVGFEYKVLGALNASTGETMIDQPAGFLIRWLQSHGAKPPAETDVATAAPPPGLRYNPQPYRQLAAVLRTAGMNDKAEEITIAGRDHQRAAACGKAREAGEPLWDWIKGPGAECAGLVVLKYALGYGVENIRVAAWLVTMTLLGFIVLQLWPSDLLPTPLSRLWYAIDNAVPLIKLADHHKRVALPTLPTFLLHTMKIAGYILATLLLASLTGSLPA